MFIMDGEELLGAKQNRVANLTILAAAHRTTVIPVSCVEQGRWSDGGTEFTVADRTQFSRGRARRMASVHASMSTSGSRRSDQAQVWESIRDKADLLDARSRTGAMSAIFVSDQLTALLFPSS